MTPKNPNFWILLKPQRDHAGPDLLTATGSWSKGVPAQVGHRLFYLPQSSPLPTALHLYYRA